MTAIVDLNKFHSDFRNHEYFALIVNEIHKSPYLVSLINKFPGTETIRLGEPSSVGAEYSDGIITFAPSMFNNIKFGQNDTVNPVYLSAFVAALGHELGHAFDNTYELITGTPTLQEYLDAYFRGEGYALLNEYRVAKELGSTMFSGDSIKQILDGLLSTHGNDVNSADFENAAIQRGAEYYGPRKPAGMNLTYNEYYTTLYVLNYGNHNLTQEQIANIDWSKITPDQVALTPDKSEFVSTENWPYKEPGDNDNEGIYDEDGYDKDGYDKDGYDKDGYDKDGYDKDGYDKDGYDKDGFDKDGFDKDGYDKDGYDKDGYDKDGHDEDGYDEDGYDKDGYDKDGYDKGGNKKEGGDDGGNGDGNGDGANPGGSDGWKTPDPPIDPVGEGFGKAERATSPLILDLDGDGVETLSMASGVYFDHDGNGFAQLTGWVHPDDGLLVLDRNNNGQIDNGAELFGNYTPLSNGVNAINGFAALADLDANGDGVIDANDAVFADLRVWRDLNGNGTVDAGELFALAELGIASLSLGYTKQNVTDAQGNHHLQVGSYTLTDGTTRAMTDVWFTEDLARTVALNTVEISNETAALPEVLGFGNVHSLRQAMEQDESGVLRNLVESFAAETDSAARTALVTQIVYAWSGVANINPSSRGSNIDARKIAAMEMFLGRSYSGGNPGSNAAAILNQTFALLTDYVNGQLMLQTHLSDLFDSVQSTFDADTQSFVFDISGTVAILQNAWAENSGEALNRVQEFIDSLKSYGATGEKILRELRQAGNFSGSGLDFVLASIGYINVLTGSDGDDILTGSIWHDTLKGNAGNDTLIGGTGNDRLEGGTGNDTYIFNIGDGHDTILDFSPPKHRREEAA